MDTYYVIWHRHDRTVRFSFVEDDGRFSDITSISTTALLIHVLLCCSSTLVLLGYNLIVFRTELPSH